MSYTLEQLADECHAILKRDPGPAGRTRICALIEKALKDEAFLAKHLGPGTPERKVIYQDPDLGFCILAHAYEGVKESKPHDHGHSWAIYGQAKGETIMSDWALVEQATETQTGKVRHLRSYTLKPGMARLYNEGDLHSPRREGPTRLIRVEGMNMDKVRRLSYESV
jgi:hypothetical protein